MLANIQVSIKAFEVESYYPARWFVKIIECLLQRATRFPFFSCQQRIRQGIIVIVPCPLGFFLMLLKVERGERGGGLSGKLAKYLASVPWSRSYRSRYLMISRPKDKKIVYPSYAGRDASSRLLSRDIWWINLAKHVHILRS